MASITIITHPTSTSFFFLLLAFSSLPIHARVYRSFSKVVNNEFPTETSAIPQETPASGATEEQPEAIPSQNQNGYGLYGRGPDEYIPASSEASRLPRTESSDRKEANALYQYDEGPYDKENGMSDTRVVENGKYFYDLNEQRHGAAYDPQLKDGRFGLGVYNYDGRGNGYYGNSQAVEERRNFQNQQEYYEP